MKTCPVVLVLAYQLCQIINTASSIGLPGAGMRMTMSEKTMQDINRDDISEFESKLRGTRFRTLPGSSSGFDYKLYRLTVSHLDALTTDLVLQPSDQMTWRGHIGAVTVTADYWFRYNLLGWDITKSGSVTVRSRGISIATTINIRVRNGQVAVDFDSCSATIKHLYLKFSHSRFATVLNTIASVFIDYIRSELEQTFCDVEKYVLSDISREMTNIKTRVKISVVGLPVVLDASISGVTIGHDGICVNTKADFLWSGRVFRSLASDVQLLAKSRHGVGIDLTTDAFSKLVSAMATSGRFNGGLGYREINVPEDQPSSVLGIHWAVRSVGLEVRAGEILGRLAGRAFFKADNGTNSELLFSALLNLTANFQARFTRNTLSFRAVGIGGLVQIDQSMIGKVLSPRWQFLVEDVIQNGVREQVLRMVNDYETELRFPLPPRTSFNDAVVRLYPGVIRVETDVCYLKTCTTNTAKWVGKHQTGSFRIEDTIPVDVTATTTSTATEKPVTTTTMTIKAALPATSSSVSLSASSSATTVTQTPTTARKSAPTVTTASMPPLVSTTATAVLPATSSSMSLSASSSATTVTTTTRKSAPTASRPPLVSTTATAVLPATSSSMSLSASSSATTVTTTARKSAPTASRPPLVSTTATAVLPATYSSMSLSASSSATTVTTTARKSAPTASRPPLVSTTATVATSSGLLTVVSATRTSGYIAAARSTHVSGSTPPDTTATVSMTNNSSYIYEMSITRKQTSGQSRTNSCCLHKFLYYLSVHCLLIYLHVK